MAPAKALKRPPWAGGRTPGARPDWLEDLGLDRFQRISPSEEIRLGRRIHTSLDRLARLLRSHPVIVRTLLDTMVQMAAGNGYMYSWRGLDLDFAGDAVRIQAALDDAERALSRGPLEVRRCFARGVAVLSRYPIAPEQASSWGRQIPRPAGPEPLAGALETVRLEKLLARVVRTLDADRDRLVLANLRLVASEVLRHSPRGLDRGDLNQEGVLGLQKAALRFDAGRGRRFSTYATYWIRQSIRRSLIRGSHLIQVPVTARKPGRKGRDLSSAPEAERIRRLLEETHLFSSRGAEEGGDALGNGLPASGDPARDETLHTNRIPRIVEKEVARLGERERLVLERHFGLAGNPRQTLEEIGKQLRVSRERIRQIENDAIAILRYSKGLEEVYEDLVDAEDAAPSVPC